MWFFWLSRTVLNVRTITFTIFPHYSQYSQSTIATLYARPFALETAGIAARNIVFFGASPPTSTQASQDLSPSGSHSRLAILKAMIGSVKV
jgi:methyl coenzyme M reductase beta subunit